MFAHNTLKVRKPGIIDEIIALNHFPAAINQTLAGLRDEIVGGVVRGLREDAPDRGFWDAASAPFVGRSWLDVPWYWAEAFLYRRILEATRYFQPGPWQGFDPFAAKKQAEWQPDAAPRLVDELLRELEGSSGAARFRRLLHASLWGNRTDLSYAVPTQFAKEQQAGQAADEQDHLLVDDWPAVWSHLQRAAAGRLAVITDNAGTELLMDLALVDHLLSEGLANRVDLHLKPQPFYVSDAMARDVAAGLHALPGGGSLAARLSCRLWAHIDGGRLVLCTHWFYASSLFFAALPADLARDLAGYDLVLVKGDANYRRLVGDYHWPLTTPFAQVTAHFPAPVVALRTFKSEVLVGLQPGQAEAAAAEDPDWLVNGRRGVIQARLPWLAGAQQRMAESNELTQRPAIPTGQFVPFPNSL